MNDFTNSSILITGGTGSFGQSFLEYILQNEIEYNSITLFSRDELKHYNLQQKYPPKEFPKIKWIIGDVRDKDRLAEAVEGNDIVVHAAAMKHVHLCEQNPSECRKTNIEGTKNLIQTIENNNLSQQVILISSDKAVEPNSVYGNSKKEAENLFLKANENSPSNKYSILRYGNVYGTSGSLIPLLQKQKATGTITITDPRMKRFFISPKDAVEALIYTINNQEGGEIIIPQCEEKSIVELAKEIAPDAEIEFIGIRDGEKLEEKLISESEEKKSIKQGNYFIVRN